MHVYTPPGYESGGGQFPVLYLLHGAFDSDDSWTTVGRAGFILDNLLAAGKAEPMIVAMPALTVRKKLRMISHTARKTTAATARRARLKYNKGAID